MSVTSELSIATPPTNVLWPPERFYWAELDAMGWRGTGVLPPGLRLAAADELPLAIGELQMVAIQIDGGRVLVCACPREALDTLDGNVVELKPASLPEGIGAGAAIDELNLLVGDCEPPALTSRRARVHAHLALTMLACALLVSVGLLRRAWAAGGEAARADLTANTALAEHGTPNKEESLSAQAKLMRAIADAARKAKPSADAASGLEAMLKAWPTQTLGKPQSVSVGADGVSMGIVVEGDPAALLKAIQAPAGYVLDEPRLATAGPLTRVSLHLRPQGGGK